MFYKPRCPGKERALIAAKAGQGRGCNERFFYSRKPVSAAARRKSYKKTGNGPEPGYARRMLAVRQRREWVWKGYEEER
jgi:hypothetical protein